MKFIRITWQYVLLRLYCSMHLYVSSNIVSTGVRRTKREVDYGASRVPGYEFCLHLEKYTSSLPHFSMAWCLTERTDSSYF